MQNLYNYSLIKILFIMKEKVQAVFKTDGSDGRHH